MISQDSHEETAVNEDSFLPAFWAIEHLGISCPDTDQGDELLEDYEDQITCHLMAAKTHRCPGKPTNGFFNEIGGWQKDDSQVLCGA